MPNFMPSNLKKKLLQSWYSPRPYSFLIPLSGIYRTIISLRQFLYRANFKKITKFSVPVIVVGNLTVGGTGKTPLVIWLAKLLQEQGYQPGIVSRGYGGRASQYPQWVNAQSDPTVVGDEAALIAQKTNCPMVVDPKRVRAIKTLLDKTNCNIVISDDGLQHYAMARDIEIVVIDGERGFGNEYCLPAGSLREPLSRLQKVDFIISNGVKHHKDMELNATSEKSAFLSSSRTRGSRMTTKKLDSRIRGNDNNEKKLIFADKHPEFYTMQMKPGEIYNLLNPNLQLTHYQLPVHAVAGIGNPDRFFASLRKAGFFVIEHSFPDHHLYKPADFNFGQDALIIMTEKDAVKCKFFATENFWCLPIGLEIETNFTQDLLQKL